MAVDLKIEVFSVDLFRYLWCEIGYKKTLPPMPKKYDEVTSPNIYIDTISDAVMCRKKYYSELLEQDIFDDVGKYSKSAIDFYLYFVNYMKVFLPYKLNIQLNVFDKFLMACVVLIEMSDTCTIKDIVMFEYLAPICLAMYFDTECKEEFYDTGGWNVLEMYANYYNSDAFDNFNEECNFAKNTFNAAIKSEYSLDLIDRFFKEKIQKSKDSACPQCYPLLSVIKKMCSANVVINEFQETEGYIQLILRLLTEDQLLDCEKSVIKGSNYDNLFDMAEELSDDEENCHGKINNDKYQFYLGNYRALTTNQFLSRLFASHHEDLNADYCMFCARNFNELSKDVISASDHCIEKIKSVINDTHMNMNIRSKESIEVAVDAVQDLTVKNNINEVLLLFSCLGTQPATSHILSTLKKRSENQINKDNLNVQIESECEVFEKRKRKRLRNRRKRQLRFVERIEICL